MNNFLLILLKDAPGDIAFGSTTIGEIASYGIWAVLILLGIALFITVIGPLIYSALNIKDSWKGIVGLIAFFAIAFVCYNIADGTLTKYAMEKGNMTDGYQMKIVNSTLSMFWLFFSIAGVLLVLSLGRDIITSFFK